MGLWPRRQREEPLWYQVSTLLLLCWCHGAADLGTVGATVPPITLRLPSPLAPFCFHSQMPGDPRGSWGEAIWRGPQAPVGHSPLPQGHL